ncbi:DNA-binding transcriptional MocR family regulator [Thermocatellispora tengchongensis]|uniref:DNA-binding transcriptional MocR family regulator n=1 Tax=Thermocatellispora tengchongensis TaxID=1073253 RepID=A0A840P5K8_9ACTN|nr:PLP-dependent aminotransferase family protein [Thermocatellispora tengchongensis]MBB5133193.1 DNA-binding transcriptional MocR family regulator [Thermocatellispora tengchongensis]
MKHDSSIAELAAVLREQVARLRPGDRLPSSRELMRTHGVSPVTVSRALGQLAAEGRVVTRPGSGTFVAHSSASAVATVDVSWQTVALGDRVVDEHGLASLLAQPPDGVIPLTGGYANPALRPAKELAAAAGRAVRRAEAWSMPPLPGLPELRRWFAAEAGGDVTASDVLVVGGGQAALNHAFRALAAPGTPVLVETPTYPGALAAARAAGLRVAGVPIDRDGVRPELLAEAFAVTGARVFFCQPTLHNPTGAVLSRERREQVLAVARAAGAFVIEDDYARYLTAAPVPPPLVALDAHGTVVHTNSLSKILAPSVRVAGVVARGPAAHRLRAAQLVESFFVARPLQETVVEFTGSPAWRRHLAAMAAHIATRRDALAAALTARMPEAEIHLVPPGGLHLWLHLPPQVDDLALAESARQAGVLVSPGRIYYPAEPPGPRLRVTHIAATHLPELAEGVDRLATVLRAQAKTV